MRNLERFQSVLLIAGIGFFLISFIGMGISPWTTLKGVKPPAGYTPLSELEKQGREIYMKEGCWHCHTQFVRPVSNEDLRYGPVSDASEYIYEVPQLFGTRRVGPDLAREAGKRTDDWHYAHFYNPRATVPWSVMPPFPWLFEEKDGQIVPTKKAQALVAYVQSLGRNKLPEMQKQEETYRANFQVGQAPVVTSTLVNRGQKLFDELCSGCHGKTGNGVGLAKPFLKPPAQDLTSVNPTPEYVFKVLHLGIPGSSMPTFREYAEGDLWALAFYVGQLYQKPTLPSGVQKTPEVVARGKSLYESICITCHGPTGRGDGPAGQALKPAPASFADLRPSPLHTYQVLEEGIPGTAMVAYTSLSSEDRWALAMYVDELAGGAPAKAAGAPTAALQGAALPETSAQVEKKPAAQKPQTKKEAPKAEKKEEAGAPPPTAELLKIGQAKFNSVCFTCHGKNGDGKGPAGMALQPPPADFTDQEWKHGGRLVDIYKVIHDGVSGTAMAPYAYFKENEIWGLVYYVKSFSDPKLRELLK